MHNLLSAMKAIAALFIFIVIPICIALLIDGDDDDNDGDGAEYLKRRMCDE